MLTDKHWQLAREYAEGGRAADLAMRHGLDKERVRTMIRSVRTAITRDNENTPRIRAKAAPDPRDAIAAELIKQGVVYREIAERTGLGYGVLKRIRLSLNLPARKRGAHTSRVLQRELRAKIKAMWMDGVSATDIARRMHISWNTLQFVISKDKLPKRDKLGRIRP